MSALFSKSFTESVDDRNVRFDDDQLGADFVEAAAHEVEQLVLVNLTGTGGMVADDVVFLQSRSGTEMEWTSGLKRMQISDSEPTAFLPRRKIDGPAEVFLRRVEESPVVKMSVLVLTPLVGTHSSFLVVVAEVHGLAVEIAFFGHEVGLIVDDGRLAA